MKIAVCISGQSRTWAKALASAKAYFSGNHEYYFFGHTWDENSWKVIDDGIRDYLHEKLDPIKLEQELKEAWDFKSLIVHPQESTQVGEKWLTWKPMMKSAMIANHLKSEYEANNHLRFDIVVKTRWDLMYPPNRIFDTLLPRDVSILDPCSLYAGTTSDFILEYRLPAIDDLFYFGSSRTMNIVESCYHYYVNGQFNEMSGHDAYNDTYDRVGVGVLLYKWCGYKNIRVVSDKFYTPIILRKEVENLKWPEEYQQIKDAFANFAAT